MSKGNTFENDLLKLIFNGTAIGNIADNAGTGPLTNLYVALHTANPGEAGAQNTSECAYTGYARVAVARSGSGWTVTGNEASSLFSANQFTAMLNLLDQFINSKKPILQPVLVSHMVYS